MDMDVDSKRFRCRIWDTGKKFYSIPDIHNGELQPLQSDI
jgi:hypothetical protein